MGQEPPKIGSGTAKTNYFRRTKFLPRPRLKNLQQGDPEQLRPKSTKKSSNLTFVNSRRRMSVRADRRSGCLLPPDLECERIGGGPAWGNPPLRNVPPPLLQAAPPPPPPPPVGQARVHEPERCENYPEWDEPVLTVCNNFEGRQRRLIPGLALVDADGGGGAVGEQSRGIREVRDLTEDHGSRFCAGHVEKDGSKGGRFANLQIGRRQSAGGGRSQAAGGRQTPCQYNPQPEPYSVHQFFFFSFRVKVHHHQCSPGETPTLTLISNIGHVSLHAG